MCLKPVKVYCNSHYIYRNSQHKLVNYVACGKCAECQQNRTNELMYRTRYQALDTFKRGGYIVFDTLTYDENNIPWSKSLVKREFGVDIPDELNFRTFDYRDFSLFMKRLRKVISSRYGSSRNIKYFVSSEYGTREGRTHRGHFHCIFFVSDCEISPFDLSHFIHQCWNQGITDGVDDKGLSYFVNNRLFYSSRDIEGVLNSVGYVGKYMNKDSEYQRVVNYKIGEIERYFDSFDNQYKFSYAGKLRKQHLRRSLSQFSKWSQGYGVSALDDIDIERLFRDGKVVMPDKKCVKRAISLPMYYYRKLFQYQKDDFQWYYDSFHRKAHFERYKTWQYNNLGILYKRVSLMRSVDTLVNLYKSRLENYSTLDNRDLFLFKDYYVSKSFLNNSCEDIVSNIKQMLGSRSLRDFAIYNIFYKHRLVNDDDSIFSPSVYLDECIFSGGFNKDKIYFYTTRKRVADGGLSSSAFVSYVPLDSCTIYDGIPFDYFIRLRSVTEDSRPEFSDFDKIGILFQLLNYALNVRKQHDWNEKQRLKKLLQKKN